MGSKVETINVLYILGAGRSGTTVLDQLLGSRDAFFSVGEINYLIDAGFGRNQKCSCGDYLNECLFWRQVREKFLQSANLSSLAEFVERKSRVMPRAKLLYQIFPALRTSSYKRELESYKEQLNILYGIVSELSGNKVIVDSSKDPGYLSILSELDNLNISVLHVIRDPRAVAYSRTKAKVKTSIDWMTERMPTQGTLQSIIKWSVVNVLASYIRRRRCFKSVVLKYEELCEDSDSVVSGVLNEFNMDSNSRVNKNVVLHTALGNPGKNNIGNMRIKCDESWRSMSSLKKSMIFLALYPLMKIYRYTLR